jgi:TRAP-type C4-dicarboxylate transport system permease small subunit
MSVLRSLNRLLVRAESALLVLFLGVMVLVAFAQVVLRNAFGIGFLWGDPLARQMVLWAGFMGAAIAANDDRHISIDAVSKFLPERARHGVRILTHLFAAAVCAALASAAWTFLRDEQASGSEIFLSVPTWVGLLIVPAGYLLMALHFAVNALESGVRFARRADREA